jgi:hypothetical protein
MQQEIGAGKMKYADTLLDEAEASFISDEERAGR